MAIPSGYRLITSSDVGKIFGTDIENIVYFDTTVSATSVYGLTNNSTLMQASIGSFVFGFIYRDPPDSDVLCGSNDIDYDKYVIDTEFGSVWNKDNYDFTGVGSITTIDSGLVALNVMYVKDIAQELTVAEKLVATNDEKLALKTALEGKSVDMTNIPFTQYHEKVTALPSPKEEETKTVTPNFASGDMVVNPTTNKVMTQITFTKDTTNHIASNIKSGVTLYGISGNIAPAKVEETKTVDLSMASGNQVVTPTTNKVMTQVTINKPATLLPANIKKDIVIGGVTGTLESGGGDVAQIIIETFENTSYDAKLYYAFGNGVTYDSNTEITVPITLPVPPTKKFCKFTVEFSDGMNHGYIWLNSPYVDPYFFEYNGSPSWTIIDTITGTLKISIAVLYD
jgi:hypothetical protein